MSLSREQVEGITKTNWNPKEKHRAVIIGCGRMGAGRDHPRGKWLYTHPEAYQALADRVEIVGFVDRVLARAEWAAEKFKVPFAGDYIVGALTELKPDIVSICTPPSDRYEPLLACRNADVSGVWCEKPLALSGICGDWHSLKIQVNWIRRFDAEHQIKPRPGSSLHVHAPNDIHTTAHFTDLARFWGIAKNKLFYHPFHGPSLYILRQPGAKAGRYSGWEDKAFIGGGCVDGFMVNALTNLLDAVEGKAELISPPENAIESEKWANEIMEGKCRQD